MRLLSGVRLFFTLMGAVGAAGLAPAVTRAEVVLHDEQTSSPLILDRADDYLLRKVYVSGVRDAAALTLAGRIGSVRLENCRFGDIWTGISGRAVGVEAIGARVSSFVATDSAFYDSENQLVSLRDGSFGTVTFLHCTFKTSDAALLKISTASPWRTALPTIEFFNIDRLELLDNEYVNTTIVIHPSVKLVVFRGDVSKLHIQSPETQVLRLTPGQDLSVLEGEDALAENDPELAVPPAPMTTGGAEARAEPVLSATPSTLISTSPVPARSSRVAYRIRATSSIKPAQHTNLGATSAVP